MVTIVEIVLKYMEPRIPLLKNGITLHNKKTSHLDPPKQKPIQGIIIPLLETHTIRNTRIRPLKDLAENTNIRSVEK